MRAAAAESQLVGGVVVVVTAEVTGGGGGRRLKISASLAWRASGWMRATTVSKGSVRKAWVTCRRCSSSSSARRRCSGLSLRTFFSDSKVISSSNGRCGRFKGLCKRTWDNYRLLVSKSVVFLE